MAGGSAEDGTAVSAEFLRRWGQLRWESVLHYMVSLREALKARPLLPRNAPRAASAIARYGMP